MNEQLTAELKQEAMRLGFGLMGVCPAIEPAGISHFARWLASGYAGEMRYLSDRQDAYRHPSGVLAGAKSLLMLAAHYRTVDPATLGQGQGRVSRYAWGTDYHHLLWERLNQLAASLKASFPDAQVRGVVDTAPLLEREFAQLAGLGWIGKNTLLLNRQAGSWFFLAALLTDVTLAYDSPQATDHCGTCRACLDACPTQAFVEPYVLDARRCISYLTIELRGPIPLDLRPMMGDWVFGCDVCQDVCPWNHRASESSESGFLPAKGSNPLDLFALFTLDENEFRRRFRHTPLWRAKRRGLLRNAAIALGNNRSPEAVPVLMGALNDEEPIIRGAAAWALGRYDGNAACAALRAQAATESDPDVLSEIRLALADWNESGVKRPADEDALSSD